MPHPPHAMDALPRHISLPSTSPKNPNPALSEFDPDVDAAFSRSEGSLKPRQTLPADSAISSGPRAPRFVASWRELVSPRPDGPSPAIATQVTVPELPESTPDPNSQGSKSTMDATLGAAKLGTMRRSRVASAPEKGKHEVATLKDELWMARYAFHRFLEDSRWSRYTTDDDPLWGLLEFAKHSQALAIENSKGFEEAVSQRTALEEQVKDLTSKLADSRKAGRDLLKKAVQDQSTSQAEFERLQEIIDTQHEKYRDALQSEAERHSATVDRLIHEHTIEMSEQMSSYEKELVELRMAHDRGLAQQEQRHRLELDLLHDRLMAFESSLQEKPVDPPVVASESTLRQADRLAVPRYTFAEIEGPGSPPVMANDSTMQNAGKSVRDTFSPTRKPTTSSPVTVADDSATQETSKPVRRDKSKKRGKPPNPPALANDSTSQGTNKAVRPMVLNLAEIKRFEDELDSLEE